MIDRYGADTARLYVMFAGKPEDSAVWSDTGVEGAYRFLRRLWTFAQTHARARRSRARRHSTSADADDGRAASARRDLHPTLKQANDDYERLQYNTVVSAGDDHAQHARGAAECAAARECVACAKALSLLLRVLYPVAPHTTWVLWRDLGLTDAMGDLIDAPWPSVDETALVTETDRARAAGERQGARQNRGAVEGGTRRDRIGSARERRRSRSMRTARR